MQLLDYEIPGRSIQCDLQDISQLKRTVFEDKSSNDSLPPPVCTSASYSSNSRDETLLERLDTIALVSAGVPSSNAPKSCRSGPLKRSAKEAFADGVELPASKLPLTVEEGRVPPDDEIIDCISQFEADEEVNCRNLQETFGTPPLRVCAASERDDRSSLMAEIQKIRESPDPIAGYQQLYPDDSASSRPLAVPSVSESLMLDEDDLKQIDQVEFNLTQTSPLGRPATSFTSNSDSRILFLAVTVLSQEACDGCLLLLVRESESQSQLHLYLSPPWNQMEYPVGVKLHVLLDRPVTGPAISVSAAENAIIYQPDSLVAYTSFSESFFCLRKAYLNHLFSTSKPNKYTVKGILVHSVIEYAFFRSVFNSMELMRYLRGLLIEKEDLLLEAGVNAEDMELEITAIFPLLLNFCRMYVLKNSGSAIAATSGTYNLKINKFTSVEEELSSPILGMKGVTDVLSTSTLTVNNTPQTFPFIIELKSGRYVPDRHFHHGQILYYHMLLSHIYNQPLFNCCDRPTGIILYGQVDANSTFDSYTVSPRPHELKDILLQRNRFCQAIHRSPLLTPNPPRTPLSEPGSSPQRPSNPLTQRSLAGAEQDIEDTLLFPTVQKQNHCSYCPMSAQCELFSALESHNPVEGLPSSVSQAACLNSQKSPMPVSLQYFKRWFCLLTREESLRQQRDVPIWMQPSPPTYRLQAAEKVDYGQSFCFCQQEGGRVVLDVGMVVFPCEKGGRVNLQRCVVTSVSSGNVLVESAALFNPLVVGRDYHLAQSSFTNFPHCIRNLYNLVAPSPSVEGLDPSSAANRRQRQQELQGMLIDGRTAPAPCPLQLPWESKFGDAAQLLRDEFDSVFNEQQRDVFRRIWGFSSLFVLQGLPGTGKSTLLAFLVKCLCSAGKRVLIVSQTNSAVDNLLLKVLDSGFLVIRVGYLESIHPSVRRFHLRQNSRKAEFWGSLPGGSVVGCTCNAVSNAFVDRCFFDYCIIDEAGQLLEPMILGPLLISQRALMVGDSFQLQPLVLYSQSQELRVPLMDRISREFPELRCSLTIQYRMNGDIMSLSNSLIYENRLSAGSRAVSDQRVQYSSEPPVAEAWLRTALDRDQSVVFLNLDGIALDLETSCDSGKYNSTEAMLVARLVEALRLRGVKREQVGVISPYNRQLDAIRQLLGADGCVDVGTVDRFQGQERDVILFSFVRSNREHCVGKLLKNWRRINVAFTRARRKLIMLGSIGTIRGDSLLSRFVTTLEGHCWIVDVTGPLASGAARLR